MKTDRRNQKDYKIIGEWTEFELFFYDNGQKKSEGTYKVGRPDGFWTFWYENGQKKCEGIIREFPIRNWTFYNEDGSIDRVVEVDKKHSQKIMVEIYGMEYQKNYKSMGK
jgi:antitoxin component YwqK of YwqJK toxin-antitoxin module